MRRAPPERQPEVWAKVSVPFDGVPNHLTSEDISIDFPGIVTIRLVPGPLDYVWYESPWACAAGL